MKPLHRNILIAGLTLALAALACNAFGAGANTPTEQVAEATATGGETLAVTPTTQTPPQGVTPSPPAAATATTACIYNGVFVADVTIPDDTPITTGQSFTKTWRLKNNGCQKWPAGTTLVFISGDQMSGPASVSVPETAPDGIQDVSVNLKAPAAAGDYKGNWQLKTPDGILFGDTIYVKIKAVAPPTNTAPPPTIGIIVPPVIVLVNYTASYVGGVWSCHSGSLTLYMYTAIVKNTGPTALESASTSLQQPVGTTKNNGNSDTPFQTSPTNADCNAAGFHASSLAPNATGWVSEFVPTTPLAGGTGARLTLKLCTQNGEGGACKTVNLDFTP